MLRPPSLLKPIFGNERMTLKPPRRVLDPESKLSCASVFESVSTLVLLSPLQSVSDSKFPGTSILEIDCIPLEVGGPSKWIPFMIPTSLYRHSLNLSIVAL